VTALPLATVAKIPRDGAQQTDCQLPELGSVLDVQLIPSGLVDTELLVVPEAQNNPSSALQQTEKGADIDTNLAVQVIPSGLVAA
jgi:hypothetical protein